jgi:hypothetical protein
LSTVFVLLSRIALNKKVTRSDEEVPMAGEDVPFGGADAWDVATRWARTGLAPLPASVVDRWTGRDVTGDPVTTVGALANLITPIFAENVRDSMLDDLSVPEALTANTLAFFGAGVRKEEQEQTRNYGPRRRSVRRRNR